MADEILKRDQNSVTVLGAVTNDANQEIRMLRVDPVTGRLLISALGGVPASSITGTIQPGTGITFTGIGTLASPYIVNSTAGTNYWTRDTVNGYLYPVSLTDKVGVGTITPNANIESLSTTEQLRLSYDASNNTTFVVDSAGQLNITSGSGGAVTLTLTAGTGGTGSTIALMGSMAVGGTSSNLYVPNGLSGVSTGSAQYQYGGSAANTLRVGVYGSTVYPIASGRNYSGFQVGKTITQVGNAVTIPWVSNAVLNSLGTITLVGSGAVTNTASVFVGAANTQGTNNYSLYVDTGALFFNGALLANGAAGTTGQVLTSAGPGAVPTWTSASGTGITWNTVSGTTQTAAINNGYITNNASLVTVTLPTTAAVGSIVEVTYQGAGGWKVAQNASQSIRFGTAITTTGTGGSLASFAAGDSVRILCITANTGWQVLSSQGNITIV